MSELPLLRISMAPQVQQLILDGPRLGRLARIVRIAEDDSQLAETEFLFTSWGARILDEEAMAAMPRLRAVFHCAGSVKRLATEAFWQRGIPLVSAATQNAIPVAQYTLAAILLANKGGFLGYKEPGAQRDWVNDPRMGNLDRVIGLVGFSLVGRRVAELLRYVGGFRILVADPFADAREVAAAGAELVSLEEMLGQVDILSLHAPALPTTFHMIAGPQLAQLRDGTCLINTARGSLVDHDALLREAASGRITAVLDVTDPEPLPLESPLLSCPNITVTSHIAGALGAERRRLTDFATDQLENFLAGRALAGQVAQADLERIA